MAPLSFSHLWSLANSMKLSLILNMNVRDVEDFADTQMHNILYWHSSMCQKSPLCLTINMTLIDFYMVLLYPSCCRRCLIRKEVSRRLPPDIIPSVVKVWLKIICGGMWDGQAQQEDCQCLLGLYHQLLKSMAQEPPRVKHEVARPSRKTACYGDIISGESMTQEPLRAACELPSPEGRLLGEAILSVVKVYDPRIT